jgi:hypothetical protein
VQEVRRADVSFLAQNKLDEGCLCRLDTRQGAVGPAFAARVPNRRSALGTPYYKARSKRRRGARCLLPAPAGIAIRLSGTAASCAEDPAGISPAGAGRPRSLLAEPVMGDEVMKVELLASARFFGAGDMTGCVGRSAITVKYPSSVLPGSWAGGSWSLSMYALPMSPHKLPRLCGCMCPCVP